MTKNTVKLTYDVKNQRFQKIVKGKRFVSSRGLLPTDTATAIKELEQWLKEQDKPAVLEEWRLPAPSPMQVGYDRAIADKPTKKHTHTDAVATFINFKSAKVSKIRVTMLTTHLNFFCFHCGVLPIDGVDRDRWESMMAAMQENMTNGKWGTTYAADILVSIRAYFKWLYDSERLDSIPRFVSSNLFSVKRAVKQPEFFSDLELQKVFKASNDKMKLWYLLSLNCGMTQIDISDLMWSQIDLEAGTLTRKRGKHEHQTSDRIPTVVYTLWPELLASLKKLPKTSDRVFVQKNGNRLVQDGRNDQIAKAFRLITKEMNVTKSYKHFRKTGTTWISKPHRQWRETYLANVSTSVTDKNYDGSTDLPTEVTNTIRQKLIELKLI